MLQSKGYRIYLKSRSAKYVIEYNKITIFIEQIVDITFFDHGPIPSVAPKFDRSSHAK